MGKCKNCGKETKNKNIYCSYKCRNVYVNKNIRDYSKNSEKLSKKKHYVSKKCLACGEELPYEKRRNKFCNQSCSATFNNEKRTGIKYDLSEEGKNVLIESANKNFKNRHIEKKKEYYSNIKRCLCCNKMLSFNKRKNVFCDRECKNDYYRKNRTEIENYRKDCQFNFSLKDYPNEFDFSLVEKYGWYKAKNRGDNLDGVSRDHMFSVMEGFRKNVSPEIISHPANCKLMIHNKNVSKNDKCSITIEELIERIEKWNKKYMPL
jgi:hypothetical protein